MIACALSEWRVFPKIHCGVTSLLGLVYRISKPYPNRVVFFKNYIADNLENEGNLAFS